MWVILLQILPMKLHKQTQEYKHIMHIAKVQAAFSPSPKPTGSPNLLTGTSRQISRERIIARGIDYETCLREIYIEELLPEIYGKANYYKTNEEF